MIHDGVDLSLLLVVLNMSQAARKILTPLGLDHLKLVVNVLHMHDGCLSGYVFPNLRLWREVPTRAAHLAIELQYTRDVMLPFIDRREC
jgi:hypothetical protein